MNLLMSDSPPKPVKNSGEIDIPPFGVVICVEADNVNANDSESEIVLKVRSPSGNDADNASGTFESDFHYHNQVGFNSGATLKSGGYGHAIFPSNAPFAAAVENAGSVTSSDLLMACSGSAKLQKVDRGTEGNPGDCTNIFGLYRPLKKTSANIWLVQRIDRPLWQVKALEDAEEGNPFVAEVLQQGNSGNDFKTSIVKKITVVATGAVSTDDEMLVGLVAGAVVRIGGGGSGEGGNGGSGATDTICACNSSGLIGSGETEDGDVIGMAFSFPDPLGSILTIVVTRDEGADGVVYISDIYEYDCPPPEEEEEE